MTRSWWTKATTEERLAQIDAAIELGLSSAFLAANVGAPRNTVNGFANEHGRWFGSVISGATKAAATRKRIRVPADSKSAYLRGEAVDFWSVR